MWIHVNERHIKAGMAGKCYECPIAMAVTETVGPGYGVCADAIWRQTDEGGIEERPMPDQAREFIRCFDRGEPVAPFSFEFPLPLELWPPGSYETPQSFAG